MRSVWKSILAMALLATLPFIVKAQAPDLTTTNLALYFDQTAPNGEPMNRNYSYNLGPTGLRGWIYWWGDGKRAWSPGVDGSQTDVQPYQVLVVSVGTSTPASGVFQIDDVLLGVNTGSNNIPVPLFTNDTRRAIGTAIGAAESGDGWMNFKIFRGGATNHVSIRLNLRNKAYSATAPYNCPKSSLILSNAVAMLGAMELNNSVDGLALLASGNASYLPKIQTYARSIRPGNVEGWTWGYSYNGVFLSEYYLKTGDTNVLPVLSQLMKLCALTDRYGSICHGPGAIPAEMMGKPLEDEYLHSLMNGVGGEPGGVSGGYGPVNNVALTANLAMTMGKKCLLAAGWSMDPAVEAAITRGKNFFGWHVQKGEIQYGEHNPIGQASHGDNGKHAQAAILFTMLGDEPAAAEYWTRMTLAGYLAREYGHCEQGISFLWTGLGANMGGTNAMAAYVSAIRWHLDLSRRSDGSFAYDGHEQFGPTMATDYWITTSYHDFIRPLATYILAYSTPLKQIYITGRDLPAANVLSPDKVANAIAATMAITNVFLMTTNQLVDALDEYDPDVRLWAAKELGSRPGVDLASITNLVGSTNAWLRASACAVLGVMKDTNSLPALGLCLSDPDIAVRGHAAVALKEFRASASSVIPTMLQAYVANAHDPYGINWEDPCECANGLLADVLFGGIMVGFGKDGLATETAKADRNLLYPVLKLALKHPDSLPRGSAATFVNSRLNVTDIQALVLDLTECATTSVLADPMWRSGGREGAIRALGKFHSPEAVPVALAMQNPWWWAAGKWDCGESSSPSVALEVLATYGDSVRWILPTLNSYVGEWGPSDGRYTSLVNAINAISAAVTAPVLTNLFPVARSQVVALTTITNITLTGYSCRTNAVTFQSVTAPLHGNLSGTPPNLTYTPLGGYSGVDSFTFRVADQMTNSAPGTVSIIVGTAGAGIQGQYYDNMDFTSQKVTRVDSQVNFDWGTGAPTNTMGSDSFSVQWNGQLLVPETGTYMFSTLNSDGARLYVNGQRMINDWTSHDRVWNDGASIELTAGQQANVWLEYYESTGNATAKLKWSGPSFGGSNGVIVGSQWLGAQLLGASVTNPPVYAFSQSVSLVQNTNQVIILAGTYTNFILASTPSNGSLSGTPPRVTYTPNPNYVGVDSFTFRVTDGVTTSAAAMVAVSILTGSPETYTWKTAVSGNWSEAAKWTTSIAPGAAGQPNYGLAFTPSGTYSATNNLNPGFALNRMSFAGTVTLAGNSICTTNNGPILPEISQDSGNAITFNAPLTLGATTTLGGLAGGQVTLNGLISGPGGLVINSSGNVYLMNTANTYRGGTIVNYGVVWCTGGETVTVFGSGPVTFNPSTRFQHNRNSLTNSVTLNGATLAGGNSFATILSGPVTLQGISTIDGNGSGHLVISGNISGSGGFITKPGDFSLSGANTYTGWTTVDQGRLHYNNAASVAPGALNILLNSTVELNYTGAKTISWLTLNGIPQPAGTYGSLTSTAANKSSYFLNNGRLNLVPAVGKLVNQAASSIATNSAKLNAVLTGTNVPYTVVAYWNTSNGGTNALAWTNSAVVGSWTLAGSTNISLSVAGLLPNKQYFFTFCATNEIQRIWATNIQSFVTAKVGANAYLANLWPGAGTLTPVFEATKTNYADTVNYAVSAITITPFAVDANAAIKVNGSVVGSGTPSSAISLPVGTTNIMTVVVSADLSSTNTYSLAVTRNPANTNAYLAGLVLSAGAFSPSFASNTLSYAMTVPYSTASLTVTPTAVDPTATLTVNGVGVASGATSGSISLSSGVNAITTVVTAQNGTTLRTYTVTVTRTAPSTDANLLDLVPSVGAFTPTFANNVFSYTEYLTYTSTAFKLTPTASGIGAIITVNGAPVSSGSAYGPVVLAVGTNMFNTVVVSEDLLTTNTYAVAVVAAQPRPAITVLWDGPNAGGTGDGASQGGTAVWSTSVANWDNGVGADRVAWYNGTVNTDNAVFGGTAGTVTLGEAITVSNLTINIAGYTITGSTLNFAAGTITTAASAAGVTISSAITGSPAVQANHASNQLLTFAPTVGSVNLGAINAPNGPIIVLAGTTTMTNSIASDTSGKLRMSSGTWTLTGVANAYEHFLEGGNLIISTGTIQHGSRAIRLMGGTLHYNNPAAVRSGVAAGGDGSWRIMGGSIDNTSGAAITTSTWNPGMNWESNLTFIGSNGADSDLYLGNGNVFLGNATRQITVQNAATTLAFGGVFSNGGLTKAGDGTLELRGANTYTGTTAVNVGKLLVNGNQSSATGNVTVSTDATLGGTGVVGGDTTVAVNGRLGFKINTPAASHDKLELAAGKSLTFSGASVLAITSTGGAEVGTYTLLTAPGGINGALPTLILPIHWAGTLSTLDNSLLLNLSETTYTVTYSGNNSTGGSVPTDANAYTNNATVTVLGNTGSLVRTGYTFAGWNTAANGSGTSYAPAGTFMISSQTTLYAQWAPILYTVTYDGNGNTSGTAPASQIKTNNVNLTLSTQGSLIKTGYTFDRWNTADNGSGTNYVAGGIYTANAGVTLYAQWTAMSAPTNLTATPLSSTQIKLTWGDATTNETGFLVQRSLTSGSGFATIASAAANVTNYTDVTVGAGSNYYYRVAATNAAAISAFSAEASAVTPKLPATVTFSNLSQTYDGTPRVATYSTSPAGLTVDLTYNGIAVAPTDAGSYAVTGTVVSVSYQGLTNGTLVVAKATPTVSAWPTADEIMAGQALSNATLTGGSASVAGSFSYVSPTNLPPVGVYTAAVTFVVSDSANYVDVAGTVNVTVSPIPTYTVTYSGNGSTGGSVPVDAKAYTNNTTVTVLGNTGILVKTGYAFTGWNTAMDGSGTAYNGGSTFDMPAADVTLHAQWIEMPTYTVSYNDNGSMGGSVPVDANVYTNGETVTVLGNTGSLVKTGYTFAGWNTVVNGSGTGYVGGSTFAMPAAEVTLYAQWTLNPMPTVSFAPVSASGAENATTVTVTVALSHTYVDTVTVGHRLSTPGGTATPGADFVYVPGTLTFNSGETSKSFTFMVVNDTSDEEDEAVVFAFGTLNNATAGAGNTFTYTIQLDTADWYAIPFRDNFEARTLGDLNSQFGWLSQDAIVQSNVTFGGSAKACTITNRTANLRHTFTDARTRVWTDMRLQVTYTDEVQVPAAGVTAAFYVRDDGRVMAYDGATPVATSLSVSSGAWVRFTILSDYASKTWVLYVDDVRAGRFGFYTPTATAFTQFRVKGGTTTVDDVAITLDQPPMKYMPSLILLR